MKPQISVIIPSYNSEKYIEAAVDSVLRQTLENFEIIIVDDASSDNTLAILHGKYGDERRIRIFENDINCGQGVARNTALRYASGDYVFFLDSDDTIEPGTLRRMYETAIFKHADIVTCGVKLIGENGQVKPYRSHEFETAGGMQALELLAERKISVYIWDKLYKKELIERHSLCFPSIYQEDIIFVMQAIYYCNVVVSIMDGLYNYCLTPVSTTRGKITEKHIYSSIEAMRLTGEFIRKLSDQQVIVPDETCYKLYGLLTEVITYYITKFYDNTDKPERDKVLHKVFQQQFGDGYFYIKTIIDYYTDKLEQYNVRSVMQILTKIKKRKIVFFGTGSACMKIIECFPLDISFFVDNDANKWDQKIQMLNIHSPSKLMKESKDDLAIIVVSQYYPEISNQLEKMGFKENDQYWNGYEMYKQLFST